VDFVEHAQDHTPHTMTTPCLTSRSSLVSTLVLLTVLTACGGGGDDSDPGSGDTPVQPDAGIDGPPGIACDLPPLTEDTRLDLDVGTAAIEGVVTLNGVQMPDSLADEPRGWVVLAHRRSGNRRWLTLGARGEARFSGHVLHGHYDILFVANDKGKQDVVPDQEVVLAGDVTVNGPLSRSFDLITTTISGTVLIDGAQVPDGTGNRGWVRLEREDRGDGIRIDLGAQGPARYAATVFAGTYHLEFEANEAVLPDLPRGLRKRVATVSLTTPLVRDLDVALARLTGRVRLNGADPGDNPSGSTRGYIRLLDPESSTMKSVSLGSRGPATFDALVYAGTYSVQIEPNAGSEQTIFPPQTMVLEETLTVAGTTQRTYDLPTAILSGDVTLDGAPIADNGPDAGVRGWVVLTRKGSPGTLSVGIGARGPARYRVHIFGGTYDLSFRSADLDAQNVLPAGGTTSGVDVPIAGDAVQNIALHSAQVTGEVLRDGEAIPDNGKPGIRGWVGWSDPRSNEVAWAPVGRVGPARYSARIFAGRYDLLFRSNDVDDQDVLPAQTITQERGVRIDTDQTRAIDLRTIDVTGAVTLDGQTLMDNTEPPSRGWLVLSAVEGQSRLTINLGTRGPAVFHQRVFAGTYDISVETNDAASQTVMPPGVVRLRKGCLDPSTTCVHPPGDVTGSWRLAADSLWGTWDLELRQSGNAVTGTYDGPYGYSGPVERGRLENGVLRLFMTYRCRAEVVGELQDGCLMLGWLRDITCPNTHPYSDWVGTRR
jgi:hypothetical protein